MSRREHGTPDFVQTGEAFPRTGTWTGNAQLGAVKLSENVGINQTLLQQPEWWMPHTWTLSLLNKPKSLGILDNAAVGSSEAEVDFGVGGSMQTFKVDFVKGTLLTFPANSVNVRLQRIAKESFIYAQLSLGTRGPCGVPQRQVFKNLLVGAGATSAAFPIPDFTDHMVLLGGDSGDVADPLVSLQLSDQMTFATVIQATPLSILTNAYGGKLSISSDAVTMRIVNASANSINLNCIAKLGF